MADKKLHAQTIRLTLFDGFVADCRAAATSSQDIVDSIVLSGLSFFTSLSAMQVAQIAMQQSILISGLGAGLQFFTIMAIKRGLVKGNATATPSAAP